MKETIEKKMYNKQQKERYLLFREKKSTDVIPLIKSIFKKIGGIEKIYEKDVGDFNREQIEDLLYYLGLGTVSSIAFVYYCLTDYVDWCISEGLIKDGMNHLRDIEYNSLGNYINKNIASSKLLTREDVLNQLLVLNNPRDKLFLLSAFEFGVGAGYEDFLDMEMGDVEKENHILHLKTRNVIVSNEWISVAEEASETYEIVTNVHDFNHPLVRKIKLEHTNKLFKNTVLTSLNSDDKMFVQKRMFRIFNSIKKTLGLSSNIKVQSIINSGRIHYINVKAKELNVSGSYFVKSRRKEIENQFSILCNPVIFLREYGNYLVWGSHIE